MRESPVAWVEKQAGLTRASPAGVFSTFSNDFRRIGERQNHSLRLLLVLGGFVAFFGRVRFAQILALLSLAVPF